MRPTGGGTPRSGAVRETVATLAELGCKALLEVGPHPVLTALAAGCWPGAGTPVTLASLRRGESPTRTLLSALAGLYVKVSGPILSPSTGLAQTQARTADLSLPAAALLGPAAAILVYQLVATRRSASGCEEQLACGETIYHTGLSCQEQPWLADHRVYGSIVVPGATFAAMVLKAHCARGCVEDLIFHHPILLGQSEKRTIATYRSPSARRNFRWSPQL